MLPIPLIKLFSNLSAEGFALESAKKTAQGKYELPSWNRMGLFWTKGFVAGFINMIYLLPVIINFFNFGFH